MTTPALDKLVQYAKQKPRLELGNYGFDDNGRRAYQSEVRSITKDLHRVRDLEREARTIGVTDADIIAAAPRSFSGRLEWAVNHWEYCVGQYWPTEYRKAVAAVLDTAIHARKQAQADSVPKPRFTSMSEVRAYHEQTGSHWFDASSMRFFGTKIHGDTLIQGRYFVTSEQPPHGSRGYTVREVAEDGDIKTIGDLGGYKTARDARQAARNR